jgi:hypothetical protein
MVCSSTTASGRAVGFSMSRRWQQVAILDEDILNGLDAPLVRLPRHAYRLK